jgi:hypothetical protein
MSREPKKPVKPTSSHRPTDGEQLAIERVKERRARATPVPRFNVEMTGTRVRISADYPRGDTSRILLADAFGTADDVLALGLLSQLAGVSQSGRTKQELNFMLSVVRGINPKDETEALLAVQMAAIHNATMVAARRINRVETIPQQDSASTMLNKLARTFATQVEALKRYRSAGEQTIKVQHVTIHDGAQAIVGNVSQGGGDGGLATNGGQPHEPSRANECGPALLGYEQALPTEMPSPGGQRLDGVPLPRSPGRRPKRQG